MNNWGRYSRTVLRMEKKKKNPPPVKIFFEAASNWSKAKVIIKY